MKPLILIKIYLVPTGIAPSTLEIFIKELQNVILEKTLQLNHKAIVGILLPSDISDFDIGTELIVEPTGNIQNSARTKEVFDYFYKTVGEIVHTFAVNNIPHCSDVIVMPFPYDQDEGQGWRKTIPQVLSPD